MIVPRSHACAGGSQRAFAGFEKPSAVQQRAIGPIVSGRDVIAQSQSGTGKTSLISISALQTLDTKTREVQVLVLSPTRELAGQIEKTVKAIGDYMSVVTHACYGGKSIGEDIRKLDNGVSLGRCHRPHSSVTLPQLDDCDLRCPCGVRHPGPSVRHDQAPQPAHALH